MNQIQKKYVILGSLCALILTLAVGYAAFQTILKINGTTNINSNWDVKITAIEKTASVGATDKEAPSYDNTKGLSATFNTNLTSPGDYATYKITITNNGSLDAILKNITIPENTNNDIIFYLNKDQNDQDITGTLKQNDTLYKSTESNNVGYVYVTVLYKDYENQQTAGTKTASMTISFDFEQKTSGGTVIGPGGDNSTVVYRWTTDTLNIGDSIEDINTTADPTTLGKNHYLKHEIDSENKITASYVCFVTDTEHCMQGGDASYYETTKALLQSQESWFTANGNGSSCEFYDAASNCYADSLTALARPDGHVNASDGSVVCLVDSDGSAVCNG